MRRVRPTPGSQLAPFTTCDYHAFVTDRAGDSLELEADHRRHAVVEQSIAELKSAGLAHLPSSKFMTNAAWLALAVMAHNLGRAVGLLAGGTLPRATATALPGDLHDAGPAGHQRATPTTAATRTLALGRAVHHRTGSDHRDPARC